MADPIAIKALKLAKEQVETIAKTGFVKKLAPMEQAVFTNFNISKRGSVNGGRPDTQLKASSLANVKDGDKVTFSVAPSGEVVFRSRTYYAAAPGEGVATCSAGQNGYGLTTWEFTFDSPVPLITDSTTGDTQVSLSRVRLADSGDEYLSCYVYGTGNHLNSTEDGTLAFSLSIFVDTEQQAYDGLTLWSSTEGSTKRFELSVDDSANATLTDVDTGESKALAGAGGSGGVFVVTFDAASFGNSGTYDLTASQSYKDVYDNFNGLNSALAYLTCNKNVHALQIVDRVENYGMTFVGWPCSSSASMGNYSASALEDYYYLVVYKASTGTATVTVVQNA